MKENSPPHWRKPFAFSTKKVLMLVGFVALSTLLISSTEAKKHESDSLQHHKIRRYQKKHDESEVEHQNRLDKHHKKPLKKEEEESRGKKHHKWDEEEREVKL